MTTVRELHNQAIKLADRAFLARHEGHAAKSVDFAHQALGFEVEAASLVARERECEPTRSILYRSAASLAWQAGQLGEARRLAQDGLSGYPPPTVHAELIELLELIGEPSSTG